MGIISRAADTYYTYRLMRTLATSWTDQEAYALGIIDENGKVLRKASSLTTQEEKSAYTLFHRLTFNLKRILEALPFGKSRLANFAAALFLIKEETGLSERQIKHMLDQLEIDFDDDLTESTWNMLDDDTLSPGTYSLVRDIAHPSTGEMVAKKGTKVIVPAMCESKDSLFNTKIFMVDHAPTKTKIYVTAKDLLR